VNYGKKGQEKYNGATLITRYGANWVRRAERFARGIGHDNIKKEQKRLLVTMEWTQTGTEISSKYSAQTTGAPESESVQMRKIQPYTQHRQRTTTLEFNGGNDFHIDSHNHCRKKGEQAKLRGIKTKTRISRGTGLVGIRECCVNEFLSKRPIRKLHNVAQGNKGGECGVRGEKGLGGNPWSHSKTLRKQARHQVKTHKQKAHANEHPNR